MKLKWAENIESHFGLSEILKKFILQNIKQDFIGDAIISLTNCLEVVNSQKLKTIVDRDLLELFEIVLTDKTQRVETKVEVLKFS